MDDLKNYLNEIRRDFANRPLNQNDIVENPFQQFNTWFEEAVNSQILDPYAMTVATVHENFPNLRVVYLRDISEEGLVFYTNYNSKKGEEIATNKNVAINFFWGELDRQIRVSGSITKVTEEVSDNYFASRPRESQIGAWASEQSQEINERLDLEKRVELFKNKFEGEQIPRPPHWGGYIVSPNRFEFWQGRPSRLHDRIIYQKLDSRWKITRLAP